ncbi:DUF2283 domain-containing protein [Amycolatopsis sp. NPDC051373]|uniref:DUF2283 domain-containing protein n=1 Tax=Amycolatopsis sp. NPDC051373 TaxID=3155801 RepID=UPI0034505E45
MINLDFSADGRVLGVEVLDARGKLPQFLLDGAERIDRPARGKDFRRVTAAKETFIGSEIKLFDVVTEGERLIEFRDRAWREDAAVLVVSVPRGSRCDRDHQSQSRRCAGGVPGLGEGDRQAANDAEVGRRRWWRVRPSGGRTHRQHDHHFVYSCARTNTRVSPVINSCDYHLIGCANPTKGASAKHQLLITDAQSPLVKALLKSHALLG